MIALSSFSVFHSKGCHKDHNFHFLRPTKNSLNDGKFSVVRIRNTQNWKKELKEKYIETNVINFVYITTAFNYNILGQSEMGVDVFSKRSVS